MDLMVEAVDVWAASIKDEPGGLAGVLRGLAEAGADLDFVVARRAAEKPGTGVVFVTPLEGETVTAAAGELGFHASESIHAVRVEGDNKPGAGAEITERLAAEGLNLRGLSAGVVGTRFILFLGFDSREDADKAAKILKEG
jgi:hypothetical protein